MVDDVPPATADCDEAGEVLAQAVDAALEKAPTPDLGGTATTKELADAVWQEL